MIIIIIIIIMIMIIMIIITRPTRAAPTRPVEAGAEPPGAPRRASGGHNLDIVTKMIVINIDENESD